MHVQAVSESNRRTFTQVVVDVFLIGVCLQFVGHGEHDDVAPSGSFGDAHDLQAFAFGFLGRGAACAQSDHEVLGTRIAQVQRMGVALRTIAEDGDLFVLDEVDVAVAIIINAHGRISLS